MPNKFPALSPGAPPPKADGGHLPVDATGVGVHEVVIENPDHAQELVDLPVRPHPGRPRRSSSRGSGRSRTNFHYQYVQVFKNKGKEAGASLSHPHSQIVATPIVPKRVKEEIYGAERLFRTLQGVRLLPDPSRRRSRPGAARR